MNPYLGVYVVYCVLIFDPPSTFFGMGLGLGMGGGGGARFFPSLATSSGRKNHLWSLLWANLLPPRVLYGSPSHVGGREGVGSS